MLRTIHELRPRKKERFFIGNFFSNANTIIETVKRAEDGNGLIVRFYESQRRRGNVTLICAFPLGHVQKVNLLEEEQETLIPDGNQVTLFVKPYEIVSLRLVQDV